MALLICAATPQEMAALLPEPEAVWPGLTPHADQDAEKDAKKAGQMAGQMAAARADLQWRSVRLKRRECLLCITGVGPINAGLAVGLCLGEARAKGLEVTAALNAGLAGAFDLTALPLCSLCLVREEIWPEYGLNDGHNVVAGAFAFPLWQRPAADGGDVRDRLLLAGPELLPGRTGGGAQAFRECRSLTVAGVSAAFDRARDLWNRYHAELENMEGFAVAYACARLGIPCVEVRSVSNKVGPRARNEKDFPGALQSLGQVLPALNLS